MQCASPKRQCGHVIGSAAVLCAVLISIAGAASASTLDHVKQAGKITFGYRTDARPFSYRDDSGGPNGYSIELCKQVAEQVKVSVNEPSLTIQWTPVSADDQFKAVQSNSIDLLCGAAGETLSRRKDVSFSLPIFLSGTGALVRADAPRGLVQILSGRPPEGPLWRGSPAQLLEKQVFSVVSGTTSESWVAQRLNDLQLTATVVPVTGYEEGVKRVLDRSSSVFFGDRAILADATARSPSGHDMMVLERHFTYESLALALARNDDDFRLVVDTALTRLYASDQFPPIYMKWFGEPDKSTSDFFATVALPQ